MSILVLNMDIGPGRSYLSLKEKLMHQTLPAVHQ